MKAILFDLDGVIYNGDVPLYGAAGAVGWAKRNGIPHLFVTNTTSRPRSAIVKRLSRLGIKTDAARILTPPAAAAAWLRKQPPGKVALFVRSGAQSEFEGFEVLPAHKETGAAYVVVGDLGEHWDFPTLNRAFRLLYHDPAATLVALGMTRYWMTPEGLALDVAPFVVALEHAADRKAVVLGKPAAPFFEAAAEALGVPPGEIVMIGDDVRADVGGAQGAGMQGVQVRTGKFRESDLEGAVRPRAVLDSVADLPAWWGAQG